MPQGAFPVGIAYSVMRMDCALEIADINSMRGTQSPFALASFSGHMRARGCVASRAINGLSQRLVISIPLFEALRSSLRSWYEHHVPRVSIPEKDPARLVRPG